MITAVDTNILLDVLIPDAPHAAASQQSLDTALQQGTLMLNEVVYAELAAHFATKRSWNGFSLPPACSQIPSQPVALARAGRAWAAYTRQRGTGFLCSVCGRVQQLSCQQCGTALRSRQHLVSDFLIGAHATVQADRLLTRDLGYYRTSFPELRLIENL